MCWPPDGWENNYLKCDWLHGCHLTETWFNCESLVFTHHSNLLPDRLYAVGAKLSTYTELSLNCSHEWVECQVWVVLHWDREPSQGREFAIITPHNFTWYQMMDTMLTLTRFINSLSSVGSYLDSRYYNERSITHDLSLHRVHYSQKETEEGFINSSLLRQHKFISGVCVEISRVKRGGRCVP